MSLRLRAPLWIAPLLVACGGSPGDDPLADGAPASDGSVSEVSGDDGVPFDVGDGGECVPICPNGFFCYKGACAQEQPACTTDDTCQSDTYCDVAIGKCVPYGPPGKDHNPDCATVVPIGLFAPEVYCEFKAAPAGDVYPAFLNVLATPMVATFEKSGTPSIVAPFYDGTDGGSEQNGVIRVLSGNDCSQLAVLGKIGPEASFVSASSPVAIGDLDGDGLPEIVAYSKPTSTTAGVIAFTKKGDTWSILWRSRNPDGTAWSITAPGEWAGPSIHDLDDDGKPEILREGHVFDNKGVHIADSPALFAGPLSVGLFPVVADMDGDGSVEMSDGLSLFRFDKGAKSWTTVLSFTGGFGGLTALADFGTMSVDGKPDGKAEIVVVGSGKVIVEALDGKVVWGPIALPGSSGGGPPTIADFDGDGLPEIAVAGSDSYVVLDPDCLAASVRPGGKCATGKTDGTLWAQKSQDHSSNITGSSVFDFDGDGTAEAIYADECFARIYEGGTGEVIFSQYMSSCTWMENPVVADVNNDDRAELIIPSNLNCGMGTAGRSCDVGEIEFPDPARPTVGVDSTFAGLRCAKEPTACRERALQASVAAQETPSAVPPRMRPLATNGGSYACPPPSTTPGAGNTCRASHPHGVAGIRVYHDFADRWVKSRSIWNQHAYSITNVNDDGTIPQTSKWEANWKHKGPAYNDFRKNVPGNNDPSKSPDLTAKGSSSFCKDGKLTLSVNVCNRGASKAPSEYTVTFYQGGAADPSKIICTAKTTKPLDVAECQSLSCAWEKPPKTDTDVYVLLDAEGHVRQCNKGNKSSLLKNVKCGSAM